jgi:ABC-2 type transport system permease protein
MATYLPTTCPILWEELRRRVRGGRGFLALLLYTGMLVLMLLLVTMADAPDNVDEWPQFGKTLWGVFYIGQLGILTLISPSLTAGAISSEREHGTLDLLLLTRMGSLTIVLGKFVGAIGQMLLIVLAGLPVIAVVFFFGGVSPRMILEGYALILASGIGMAALGFLASCLFKRITSAVGWAYGFTLAFLLGLPIALYVLMRTLYLPGEEFLTIINPFICAGMHLQEQFSYHSGSQVQVWPVVLIMLAITVLALAECTMIVRRLRGLSKRFLPTTLKKPGRVRDEHQVMDQTEDPADAPVEAGHD